MRAIFVVDKNANVIEHLERIAEKYNSKVFLDDDDTSHFILIKPRLKVVKIVQEDYYLIEIYGAKQQDIDYFKTLWGEPDSIMEEKLTPQEFAQELTAISNVHEKTKEEIMTIMTIDERTFLQYSRLLDRFKGRRDAPEEIKEAIKIFQNFK